MAKSDVFTVSFPPDVKERVDSYCQSMRLPRSSFLQLAAVQYLDAVEAMPSVNKLMAAMSAVLDGTLKGEVVPSEAKAKLDSICETYKSLTGKDIS